MVDVDIKSSMGEIWSEISPHFFAASLRLVDISAVNREVLDDVTLLHRLPYSSTADFVPPYF